MDSTDLGLLVLRLVIGLVFAAHGAQKALGWWGGPGWAGWTGALRHMGIRLTPLAAAALIGQSLVIIFAVHWAKGFWNSNGGWEFPIALAAGAVAIAATGPGAISLDAALGLALAEPVRLALAALALLGGLVALAIPRLAPRAPEPAQGG